MAVSNYDPRWLDVLRDGATKEITLTLPDMTAATTLRSKLYRLRKDMGKEKHPFYDLVAKISITACWRLKSGKEIAFINNQRTPPPAAADIKETILTIKPHDKKYESILESAGYKIPEIKLD
jgi:hypothetical protein